MVSLRYKAFARTVCRAIKQYWTRLKAPVQKLLSIITLLKFYAQVSKLSNLMRHTRRIFSLPWLRWQPSVKALRGSKVFRDLFTKKVTGQKHSRRNLER